MKWIFIALGLSVAWNLPAHSATNTPAQYTGSGDCRSCHEDFYSKWSTSRHGLAMQPVTPAYVAAHLPPMTNSILVAGRYYRMDVTNAPPIMRETGPDGQRQFPLTYVLGGKNVCYFLTPLDRGRLQTLPVAFDVRRKEWFDTAASAMRHFPNVTDEALHWTEPPYTFNTSCHSCHVSQLARNYDPATDTYHTTWVEPGINCETCHGPGSEHVRVCIAAYGQQPPADLKIIRTTTMTPTQRDDLCLACHAKASILSEGFPPGARFHDHFSPVTLEHPDYYPDGRDLGENYTYTTWRLSPCRASEKFECLHCHTSSGRFRQHDNPNAACLPCHEQRVRKVVAHSRHPAGTPGSRCISCHMPQTEFGRMIRSDHSMLPPTPAATLAFGSPNACNICHTDKDAAWADQQVRSWHAQDYQAPVLHRASLIAAARTNDWSKLADILAYLTNTNHNEIFAASLARLLNNCPHDDKWPALRRAASDPSPIVRNAAVTALGRNLTDPANRAPILDALRDEYRSVRLAAASAMLGFPRAQLTTAQLRDLDQAVNEYRTMLASRPDSSVHQYNLAHYHHQQGELAAARAAYQTAIRLDPNNLLPLVNLALLHASSGDTAAAENLLRRAHRREPQNAAVNFNLGLLTAEQGHRAEAEQFLRAALKADPTLAAAAYNLAVLVSGNRLAESLALCRQAMQHRPDEPKYGFTLAFYQRQSGDLSGAVTTLEQVVRRHPGHLDSVLLLGTIHEQAGRLREAAAVYQRALAAPSQPAQAQVALRARLARLAPQAP